MSNDWDILSMGECMVEFYQMGTSRNHGTVPSFTTSFGGDTFNVVAMASRLGASSTYLTRIGDDLFGKDLARFIESYDVSLEASSFVTGNNGIYFIEVDPDGERHFQYYRSGSAASQLTSSDVSSALLERCSIFYTSGITQALSLTAQEAVKTSLQKARDLKRVTAFDINYRPRLWQALLKDQALAEAEARASEALTSILSQIQILFLSEAEISVLSRALGLPPQTDTLPDSRISVLIQTCWQRGIQQVVLKRGPQGAILGSATDKKIWALRPFTVEVRDTTGAGDVFNGAYLATLNQGKSNLECARSGIAAATLKVRGQGSVASLPTREEVVENLDRVETSALAPPDYQL